MPAETARAEFSQTMQDAPAFETLIVPSTDGLALAVRDYAPAPPVTGLPVVCLHGLTRNVRDFELVAPRIAALGRRVIAMDVRGRGESARDPDPGRYTPIVYAQDTLAVLDKLGVDRAVFLGTSMGGIITMVIANTAGKRVAAAILNDVGPILEHDGYMRIMDYVGKTMVFADAEAALAALKATYGAAHRDRDEEFWRTYLRRTTRALPNGGLALDYDPAIAKAFEGVVAPPDLTSLFDAFVSVPLLVVHGANSDLLSNDGIEMMRIVQPDLRYVDVPGVGHAPSLEEEPAWLAIVDFLAETP